MTRSSCRAATTSSAFFDELLVDDQDSCRGAVIVIVLFSFVSGRHSVLVLLLLLVVVAFVRLSDKLATHAAMLACVLGSDRLLKTAKSINIVLLHDFKRSTL